MWEMTGKSPTTPGARCANAGNGCDGCWGALKEVSVEQGDLRHFPRRQPAQGIARSG